MQASSYSGSDVVPASSCPVRVAWTIGLSTAELVVEDRPPAGLGHPLERLEVVVRRARAAVEVQDGELPLPFAVADDPVPGLVAAEGDVALGAVHLSAARIGRS